MTQIIREADEDVFDLLDTEYVAEQIQTDACIFFACVKSNDREDDTWINDEGKLSLLIALPYEQVKGKPKEAVRELMLEKAQARLKQAA